jgi:hypothetical protein
LRLLSRTGDSIRSLSRLQRELLILGIGLVLGMLVVPATIWLGGTLVLGPYAGGKTLFSLLGNFFKALGGGAPAFWAVALGPYALILLARLLVAVLRGTPDNEAAAAPPAPVRRQSPSPARRPAAEVPRRPPGQPNRTAPQQPGGRRTPFIKSID